MGLWIQCGIENAVFTMGWEKFAKTEEGAAGHVQHESHFESFLKSKVLCIMNSHVRGNH
jgi:hypothetical protein